jgi:hypothetical protein
MLVCVVSAFFCKENSINMRAARRYLTCRFKVLCTTVNFTFPISSQLTASPFFTWWLAIQVLSVHGGIDDCLGGLLLVNCLVSA